MPGRSRRINRPPPDGSCIAIIADVVQSKAIRGEQRGRLQQQLKATLEELNESQAPAILSKFVITVGDEFQGLLSNATAIPDMIWMLEQRLRIVEIRFGIGCGRLETSLEEYAIGMDGPVWHVARNAVTFAKSKDRLGGVFKGFGEPEETILNGIAGLLRHIRAKLTDRQRAVFDGLRSNPQQAALAETWGISKQAVSKQARSAGWEAYREGETAWKAALRKFDFSTDWGT